MKRKQLVKNTMGYAAALARLEAGKSHVKVGDMRQIMKIMENLEVYLIKKGYKSAVLMIRRNAVARVKKSKKAK